MKRLHIYIVLLSALLGSFCHKKKYPESAVVNDSVYGFTAIIGNKAVSLAAGLNDYYMFSSYSQGADSVYRFAGSLKQTNCTDCRNSINIQINDFRVSEVNGPMQLDALFFPHELGIVSGTSVYTAHFQSQFNKTAGSYFWDFGDGTTAAGAGEIWHSYKKQGNYAVRLKITSDNGCESTIRQVKTIGSASYRTDIGVSSLSGNTISFKSSVTGGKQPYSYLWNFGDGQSSSDANPSHTYAIGGGHPVSLTVTDADNRSTLSEYNAVTQHDNSSCAANFTLPEVQELPNGDIDMILSKIVISWTDENGVIYTSDSEEQPADSHFRIVSVEEAGTNENGQPIIRLHVTFSCTVYNNSEALKITNAEATIAVAYKK